MIVSRAPGKLMLLGEYAVLHGGRALVAAVDRYAECYAAPGDGPALVTPGAFAEALLARHPVNARYRLDSSALGVEAAGGWTKLGLGSSAATTVALARALMPESSAQDVFEEALAVHREVQGSGSGADVAACAFGGLLAYRSEPREIEALKPFGRLLTVWTGQPASTGDLVRAVGKAAEREPEAHRAVMDRIAAAAEAGIAAVVDGDRTALAHAAGKTAGALLALDGLTEMSIFPQRVYDLQAIAGDFSVVVKPTGAGGGDLAWCVAPDRSDEEALALTLETEGWPVFWLEVVAG